MILAAIKLLEVDNIERILLFTVEFTASYGLITEILSTEWL